MTTGLVEQGFDSLRASLGPLFFLIWTRPRPITSLARQLGVTKQACSQLANLAERASYVERIPSSEDGRSKLLRLSERGHSLVERSIAIVRTADADYAAIVGPKRYARFTETIAALYKALELPVESGLAFLENATRTVGTLPLVTQRAQQALMQATAEHGHDGLKMSHGQVLPFVGTGGVRTSDLARIHRARRQAIGATVRDLVALGYLRKEADPLDRRGAVLFLSNRGSRLVSDSLVELGALQQRIARALGRRAFGEFLQTAAMLHAELGTHEDIFDVSLSTSTPIQEPPPKTRSRRDWEMEQLAAKLHRELGHRRSIRLAALLHSRAAAAH